LRKEGVRVLVDDSDDRMQKKIRNHTKDRVPFMLIAGEEDRSNRAVSFRFRDGSQENGVPLEQAVTRILDAIRNKEQV
jgi:threonyl-tRNA synthetase